MTERLHYSVFNPQDTVYLTPDSSTGKYNSVFNPQATVYLIPAYTILSQNLILQVILSDLEEMDCSKVYVIGGIVDLSINKV